MSSDANNNLLLYINIISLLDKVNQAERENNKYCESACCARGVIDGIERLTFETVPPRALYGGGVANDFISFAFQSAQTVARAARIPSMGSV